MKRLRSVSVPSRAVFRHLVSIERHLACLGLVSVFVLVTACPNSSRNGTGSDSTGDSAGISPRHATAAADTSAVPVVPILSRYEVLAVHDVLPVGAERADYSGVTVVAADSGSATLWLCDDKALRIEDAIHALRLDIPWRAAGAAPGRPPSGATPLEPAPVAIRNDGKIPGGDDIEDIGWLPPAGQFPGLLAAAGERGPGDTPVSWFYLLVPEGQGLRLTYASLASPAGESVGNDGMEGLALRRSGETRVELYLFKERPTPYVRSIVLAPNASGYAPVPGPVDSIVPMPAFLTQAGAAFLSGGRKVAIIDRQRRRIGIAAARTDRPGLETRPLEWIGYTAIDSLLEGRSAETPPSFFGVLEGIAEDSLGRLYLLADNNEVRHSRLLVLGPLAR